MDYVLVTNPDRCIAILSGKIDEGVYTVFAAMSRELSRQRVVFKMGAITGINSYGCRGWIQAMRQLVERHDIECVECPVLFVDSCNILPAFLPQSARGHGVAVKSFYVPYNCRGCGIDAPLLISVEDIRDSQELSPRVCAGCGGQLAPEIHPEDYFAFLSL